MTCDNCGSNLVQNSQEGVARFLCINTRCPASPEFAPEPFSTVRQYVQKMREYRATLVVDGEQKDQSRKAPRAAQAAPAESA